MSRRIVLSWLAAALWMLPGIHGADRPPNIIFILADDLSYGDLGCFGQTQFATPQIDRLAAEGRVFTMAYAAGPWCAPSRTSLLTGRSTVHFGPGQAAGAGQARKLDTTVAEVLRAAGYATAALGKWHMFDRGDTWQLPGKTWEEQKANTDWARMPWNRGFDFCRIGYRGTIPDGHGNPFYPLRIETGTHREIPLPENANIDSRHLWSYRGEGAAALFDAEGRYLDKTGSPRLRHSEDVYREAAVEFMRANRDRPFFLYYATPLMHGPLGVPSIARFRDKPADWTMAHRIWAAMAEYLDGSVGVIVDTVRKLGLEKDTILIFASDNGYSAWGYFERRKRWEDDPIFKNKGPWNRGKFVTTNGGVIVPFIAWGPGRVPPGRTGRAVNFYDFPATAAELARTRMPGPGDGVSFVPLLEGRDADQPVRPAMVWSHVAITARNQVTDDWDPGERAKANPPAYKPDAVLLDEKWFALGFRKKPAPAAPVIRLFDVAADPGMERDLSSVHGAIRERAAREIRAMNAAASETP